MALGVVTAINGARRLNCTFSGEAGHAGTVPMGQRKDALVAAAEWITAVETLTCAADSPLVATVGCIESLPGAVNVIPGEVKLTLDVRGLQDAAGGAIDGVAGAGAGDLRAARSALRQRGVLSHRCHRLRRGPAAPLAGGCRTSAGP